MTEQFHVHELANGMTLLGQRMEHVSSAAMCLAVPAGAACDPDGCDGAASVACEWVFRGAGERDTRRLNDALDALGCQRREDVDSAHVVFSAAQLARNLGEVLGLYADVVRRPRLEDEAFEPCRTLVFQDLVALDDEPARKCGILLRERFYPRPLGRCVYGTSRTLQAMTPRAVRRHVAGRFAPGGSILAAAGDIDWSAFCDLADRHFGDWSTPPPPEVQAGDAAGGTTHLRKESAQAHIALAHAAPTVSDARYYPARLAAAVLSEGMGSRLFTEVREKRGLVYHVGTRYHTLKDHAGMFTYAGARPGRAQETFEVTVGELRRLAEGIEPDEMTRARTQLKSAVVMQGESTAARAGALVHDWYHLRRLRSLQEICDAVDKVTVDDCAACLRDYPAADFTILVIGPEPVDPRAIHR